MKKDMSGGNHFIQTRHYFVIIHLQWEILGGDGTKYNVAKNCILNFTMKYFKLLHFLSLEGVFEWKKN